MDSLGQDVTKPIVILFRQAGEEVVNARRKKENPPKRVFTQHITASQNVRTRRAFFFLNRHPRYLRGVPVPGQLPCLPIHERYVNRLMTLE